MYSTKDLIYTSQNGAANLKKITISIVGEDMEQLTYCFEEYKLVKALRKKYNIIDQKLTDAFSMT